MSNVTQFPKAEPIYREVAQFGEHFLEGMLFGSDWKDLARDVNNRRAHIPVGMHAFIAQMMARERRPTINQLAMLTGLFIQGMARERMLDLEKTGAPESANVVRLRK
jgi:hypothetical protein